VPLVRLVVGWSYELRRSPKPQRRPPRTVPSEMGPTRLQRPAWPPLRTAALLTRSAPPSDEAQNRRDGPQGPYPQKWGPHGLNAQRGPPCAPQPSSLVAHHQAQGAPWRLRRHWHPWPAPKGSQLPLMCYPAAPHTRHVAQGSRLLPQPTRMAHLQLRAKQHQGPQAAASSPNPGAWPSSSCEPNSTRGPRQPPLAPTHTHGPP